MIISLTYSGCSQRTSRVRRVRPLLLFSCAERKAFAASENDVSFRCGGATKMRSLWGLTFELTGRQRRDARPGLAKMYRVPPGRAWWPAVGAPVERGVRPRRGGVRLQVPVQLHCRRTSGARLSTTGSTVLAEMETDHISVRNLWPC
jgi:hypothetical protein